MEEKGANNPNHKPGSGTQFGNGINHISIGKPMAMGNVNGMEVEILHEEKSSKDGGNVGLNATLVI
jgi:hypothetical protein